MLDFNRHLVDLDGVHLKVGDEEVTLKKICVNALLNETQETQKESGEDKIKRYDLAHKIHTAKSPIEVTSEQRVMLKKKVNDGYSALIVAQTWALLEAH